jgi:hypothetical protein
MSIHTIAFFIIATTSLAESTKIQLREKLTHPDHKTATITPDSHVENKSLNESFEFSSINYTVEAFWDSHYVSEGRNNLDDGGMFSALGSAQYKGFVAGAWYGIADTVSYDELNLFAEHGWEFDYFDISAAYTRLEFLKDEECDNELSAGLSLTCVPVVVPSVNYVYSTEADGGFVELILCSPHELLEGKIIVDPYIMQCIDLGYASDEYDGWNNTQVGIAVDYNISDTFCLIGTVNQSWANQDVRQDGGRDERWLSVGLRSSF